MSRHFATPLALLLLTTGTLEASEANWVERSNEHAQIVLEASAEFRPEGAASMGVDGLDEEIFDLRPGLYERVQTRSEQIRAELERRLENEQEPLVRQDLQILLGAVDDSLRTRRLNHELLLPYLNMPRFVFFGIRALIDPQVSTDRYPAAVVRLRRYAGIAEG